MTATTRCSASVEGRRCRSDAMNVLEYDNWGFLPFVPGSRQRYQHPLCDLHSDTDFHLRDTNSRNWRLRPVKNGSTPPATAHDG